MSKKLNVHSIITQSEFIDDNKQILVYLLGIAARVHLLFVPTQIKNCDSWYCIHILHSWEEGQFSGTNLD